LQGDGPFQIVIEVDIGRRNCQLSALRHGVPRIDDQIHDDLLELAGVRLDQPPAMRTTARRIANRISRLPKRRPSRGGASSEAAKVVAEEIRIVRSGNELESIDASYIGRRQNHTGSSHGVSY
jgi:hypothetical protein